MAAGGTYLTLSRSQKSQVNGLVHISQLADEFVANCDDYVKEGDMVRVKGSHLPYSPLSLPPGKWIVFLCVVNTHVPREENPGRGGIASFVFKAHSPGGFRGDFGG